MSSVRSNFHHQYQKFLNDISNIYATNNILNFLTSSSLQSFSSSSPSSSSSFASLPGLLQVDMELASIDMISLYADIERGYGYCERAIAILVALIEMNILGPVSLSSADAINLFEEYWESEYPRATDVTIVSNNMAGTFNGWILAGKPKDGWKLYETLHLASRNETLNDVVKEIDNALKTTDITSSNNTINADVTTTATATSTATATATAHSSTNDTHTNDTTPELTETYVYSRLHGYRIKITNEDTGAVYRKILGELDDVDDNNTSVSKKSQPKSKVKSKSTLNDRYRYQYAKENLLTSLACRPVLSPLLLLLLSYYHYYHLQLRAYADCDVEEGAANPDRVVLIDDIRPYLVSVSSHAAKMRLIIRTLQHLGLTFPYDQSTSSLSSLSWFDEYIEDCTYDSIARFGRSSSSSPLPLALSLTDNFSGIYPPMLDITVGCYRQHELAHRLGQVSRLDTAISIMTNILYTNSNKGIDSKIDIYNITISLISIRARVELACGIHNEDTIIIRFRTECRQLGTSPSLLLPSSAPSLLPPLSPLSPSQLSMLLNHYPTLI